MSDRTNVTTVMLFIEAAVLGLMLVLLAGGLAASIVTGYKVGPAAGYFAGLSMLTMATSMGVGAGALHFHRREIQDNARIEAKVNRVAEVVAANRLQVQALVLMDAKRTELFRDELAARRNSN